MLKFNAGICRGGHSLDLEENRIELNQTVLKIHNN
jgi:hypothetical protein